MNFQSIRQAAFEDEFNKLTSGKQTVIYRKTPRDLNSQTNDAGMQNERSEDSNASTNG